MAEVISVINDKGGVSKTTTVINLGTALWLLGKKVLLVDNDPQSNLTLTLDKTAMQADINLFTWMCDKKSELPIYTRYDGLDYIPGSRRLGELEDILRGKAGSDQQLEIRMRAISSEYDYIIIDCAPGGKTLINMNALRASTEVIIPIRPDLYSVAGRGILMDKIMEIRDLGNELKVAGVLLTQFDARTEMGKKVKAHYQKVAKEDPDMPLFSVEIRKCEAINKAPGAQMSIFEFDSTSTVADDYMRLAELLVNTKRVPRKKTWTPVEWGRKALKAYDEFIKIQQSENNK